MAIQVKVDTEDFPGIISMLGLGGSNALPAGVPVDAAPDASELPPVDASLGGESDPYGQPASSDSGDGEVAPKNKLQTLRDFLNPSPDIPVPSLQVPGQSQEMPPADLAASEAAGTARIKPTFREAHPIASTLLRVALNAGQGGLIGSQFANAGEAFQAAKEATDPIRKKMEDAALAEKQAATAHQKAVTAQMGSQVTLPNGLTVPLALAQKLYPTLLTEQGKNTRAQAGLDSRESLAADRNAIALRAKGLKPNPAGGAPIPLTRDEMSETEQATLDLKQSQQDAAAARAELDRQKNNPDSPAYKAAMGRLQVAAENAKTAASRLGLARDTFNANYFGTGPDGQALPGAPTDENGNPIGPRVANAGKPSADRLKRGDLAANAIHNLNNIEEIIGRRGDDLFGPIMGRISNIRDMVGSDDPDLAAIGTEIHNYALASNGAHGVRSQQAVEKTEDEILKHMKRGTNGAMGGIRAAKDSLLDFVKDQQLGNRARSQNPTQPKGQPQATHVYNPDGTITPIGH